MIRLDKLTKKQFLKNWTSDNLYTRTTLEKETKVEDYFKILYFCFDQLTDEGFQPPEINALVSNYISEHFDIEEPKWYHFKLEKKDMIIEIETTKIEPLRLNSTLRKEWLVGDYLKIIGEVINILEERFELDLDDIEFTIHKFVNLHFVWNDA